VDKIGHAVNVFVSIDGIVYVIDPQGGKIVRGREWKTPTPGSRPYVPTRALF